MRKTLLVLVVLLGLSFNLKAQNVTKPTLKKGDIMLNANIAVGLGAYFGASGDYVWLDNLGGGAISSGVYSVFSPVWGFSTGVQTDYHYMFGKLDTYAGMQIGYSFPWTPNSGEKVEVKMKGSVAYNMHLGGRYYFTPNFGTSLEFGFGTNGFSKLGLTYKF